MFSKLLLVSACLLGAAQATYKSEVWTREQEDAAGIVQSSFVLGTRPQDMLMDADVPSNFTWCDKDGTNYCTMSRNQHLPQYCGSCWAHGAISSLGDRIKIARKAKGIDINLSVQHMLNCGNAGSCHGGSVVGPFAWISQISKASGTGISYETSNPYLACSSESTEGFCGHADTTCTKMNIAGTCSTFSSMGGHCTGINKYPNATVAEYSGISGRSNMQKEIFARGPIACGIDAVPLLKYTGGIMTTPGQGIDHVISVVGWGNDAAKGGYWIVRNSWGEFWGEMGYVRVAFGAMSVEDQCAWGTVGSFTTNNFPCYEGGENCQ